MKVLYLFGLGSVIWRGTDVSSIYAHCEQLYGTHLSLLLCPCVSWTVHFVGGPWDLLLPQVLRHVCVCVCVSCPLWGSLSRCVCAADKVGPAIAVTVAVCFGVVCTIIDQSVMEDEAWCASVDCFVVRAAGSRVVVSQGSVKQSGLQARVCMSVCVCAASSTLILSLLFSICLDHIIIPLFSFWHAHKVSHTHTPVNILDIAVPFDF